MEQDQFITAHFNCVIKKILFTFVLLVVQYNVLHSEPSKNSSHQLRSFSFIGLDANTQFGDCDLLKMEYYKSVSLENFEGEEWLEIPIPEFKGMYLVSNYARVKGLPRWKPNNSKMQFLPERIMRQYNHFGYCASRITIDGYTKIWLVHRLVGFAWIPNPNNMPDINHIDTITTNNLPHNLEWTDKSGNGIHAWANGLNKGSTGRIGKLSHRSIAVHRYDLDGNFIETHESMNIASKKMGVCVASISQAIKTGGTSCGYRWKVANG